MGVCVGGRYEVNHGGVGGEEAHGPMPITVLGKNSQVTPEEVISYCSHQEGASVRQRGTMDSTTAVSRIQDR